MMDLAGKRVVVLGLGRSGLAAAALARRRGAEVVGTDSRTAGQLAGCLPEVDYPLMLGGHESAGLLTADLIVVSPGVPPLKALRQAEQAGVRVVGELEFAARYCTWPLMAVGGTNGKSTTTLLIASLLQGDGLSVFAGGNLGVPLSEALLEAEAGGGDVVDWAILEVSSFQLERAPTFGPKVGLLLNISEDHLDRYPHLQAYADAKGNAFVNQSSTDIAIVPFGDASCRAQVERGRGRIVSFGTAQGSDYRIAGRTLFERASGDSVELDQLQLHGQHNLCNAAAAIAAARAVGVSWQGVRTGLSQFRPLPHRMQLVGEFAGVRYYDDSKATNVGAAVTAISGLMEPRCVLIAGGRDKQGSYQPLVDVLRARGRALITLGEAGPLIAQAAAEAVDTYPVPDMQSAVSLARRLARQADAVLLSPACSSFDMYKSYAERGEDFARAVRREFRREDP